MPQTKDYNTLRGLQVFIGTTVIGCLRAPFSKPLIA